jgi:hypothetical protein
VVFGLEPSLVISTIGEQQLAQGNPFFAIEGPSPAFVIWAVAWVVLALVLGVVLLRRREL